VVFYSIEWKNSAKKEIRRLPKKAINNIITAVEKLKNNPHPAGNKKIIGTEHTYRQRIGDYRIVYPSNLKMQKLTPENYH
jgi:mRNA interferase RelE/StbE